MKTVPASLQKWVSGNRCIRLRFHTLSQIRLKYYFILIIWTFINKFQLHLDFSFNTLWRKLNFKYTYLFYSLFYTDMSQLQAVLPTPKRVCRAFNNLQSNGCTAGVSRDLTLHQGPPRSFTPPQAVPAAYWRRQSWLLPELGQELWESTQHARKMCENSSNSPP